MHTESRAVHSDIEIYDDTERCSIKREKNGNSKKEKGKLLELRNLNRSTDFLRYTKMKS